VRIVGLQLVDAGVPVMVELLEGRTVRGVQVEGTVVYAQTGQTVWVSMGQMGQAWSSKMMIALTLTLTLVLTLTVMPVGETPPVPVFVASALPVAAELGGAELMGACAMTAATKDARMS